MTSSGTSDPADETIPADPETPERELTRVERRAERQRLKQVRKARRKEVKKNMYNGKNRAKGKHAKGKKR